MKDTTSNGEEPSVSLEEERKTVLYVKYGVDAIKNKLKASSQNRLIEVRLHDFYKKKKIKEILWGVGG